MTTHPRYKVIPEATIVALLPATVRELATSLGRSTNTINERIGLMAARGVVRVGNKLPRIGMTGPARVYYPGGTVASAARVIASKSEEQRRQQQAACKAEARKIKQEVKQLGEQLKATNDPKGLQYGMPPPLGVDLLLLTTYGKFVVGNWRGLTGDLYTAWTHLPNRSIESEKILARKLSLTPTTED